MKQFFTVIAILTSYCVFAQNAEISGKIIDPNTKEAIVGASVRYDKSRGVITDANGYYKISLAEGQYDISYTSIGYKKQKLTVTVKAGENSSYDPDSDMELEFELWGSVRYNFFSAAPSPPNQWESQLDFQVDVESRGLHVAAACDPKVRESALARFGSMYLGCVH